LLSTHRTSHIVYRTSNIAQHTSHIVHRTLQIANRKSYIEMSPSPPYIVVITYHKA